MLTTHNSSYSLFLKFLVCHKQLSVHYHSHLKHPVLNIRSVCNKAVAVNDIFFDHQLDVLALTETWHEELSDTCLTTIIPLGGSIVEQARPISRKAATSDSFVNHGGIACLAWNGIRMTKVNLPHKPVSFEVLCVQLRSGNSTSTSILSIIYRPGSKSRECEIFL